MGREGTETTSEDGGLPKWESSKGEGILAALGQSAAFGSAARPFPSRAPFPTASSTSRKQAQEKACARAAPWTRRVCDRD